MSKLLIITGISGTGKTTLAKMLYQKIDNSVMLSFDKLSENIYDMLGFQNKQEKRKLQKFNEKLYNNLIEKCMKRQDAVIIIEKPFKIKWKKLLDKLSQQYHYEIYTINLYAKNFETIWKRLLKREQSKEERHPSHYLTSYSFKKKDDYEPYFEYEYNRLKEEYKNLISNNINLGHIINIGDIEELNIDKLIEDINAMSTDKKMTLN